MKFYEIENKANAIVAQLMADGYTINFDNEVSRNDAVILKRVNGGTADFRMVKVENDSRYIAEDGKHFYGDVVTLVVYCYDNMRSGFRGILWEDRADRRETVGTYYAAERHSYHRNEKWYYDNVQDAFAQQVKHNRRCDARRVAARRDLDTSRVSDSLLDLVRRYRGFKRATSRNMSIVKTTRGYEVRCTQSSAVLVVSKSGARLM